MTGAALNSGDYVRHLTQDRGPRQQEATDIFKLASSSSDTSQSLVDQLIARLVTAYLQVELTDADVTPRKNFVSDAPIRLERGLLGRFGEMLRTKSKELPVARRRASEAAPDRL